MALLRRELRRQVKGPDVTHAECCTLVFDTDAKTLYVEREVAHVDVGDGRRRSKPRRWTFATISSKAAKPPGIASYGGCCGRFLKMNSIRTTAARKLFFRDRDLRSLLGDIVSNAFCASVSGGKNPFQTRIEQADRKLPAPMKPSGPQ